MAALRTATLILGLPPCRSTEQCTTWSKADGSEFTHVAEQSIEQSSPSSSRAVHRAEQSIFQQSSPSSSRAVHRAEQSIFQQSSPSRRAVHRAEQSIFQQSSPSSSSPSSTAIHLPAEQSIFQQSIEQSNPSSSRAIHPAEQSIEQSSPYSRSPQQSSSIGVARAFSMCMSLSILCVQHKHLGSAQCDRCNECLEVSHLQYSSLCVRVRKKIVVTTSPSRCVRKLYDAQ
eukprot:scaffold2631_cov373-Pavlova_lutheri.AAC.14